MKEGVREVSLLVKPPRKRHHKASGDETAAAAAVIMEAKYSELRAAVDSVPAIDAHAHNLVAIDSSIPFLRCFSEAEGKALSFVPQTLSFKRSLRDIAGLYNCEASLSAVENHRNASGLAAIASQCFLAANVSAVFIDDGIMFDKMHDWEWHRSFAPAVGRILRIEHLAETILNNETLADFKWTLDSFTELFVTKMTSVVDKIIGMKSIAAYRSGLDIDTEVSKVAAEEGLWKDLEAGRPVRIKNKNFIDYIFTRSMEVASSYDLPMQIHTGFGDKDLDLRQSNPLHLRKVLEDKRFERSCIILLHASYPFSKEASYLASVYPQVYLDFGLAVPKLSVQGMIASLKELLELAPTKKVMFSSDGYAFPETFFLGAKRARAVVFTVLSSACEDGDLTIPEALEAVQDIFRRNALQLYRLKGIIGCIENQTMISWDTATKISTPPSDIVFVRIIWVDASGQQRCRVVPKQRFYGAVKDSGVGLAVCIMGMTSFADGPAVGSNLTAVGEIRLVPDLSTKHRIPWARLEEMVLADMQIKPGVSWDLCPRNCLRRLAKILKDEFNMVMNAGFENEFYLLKSVIREGKEQWLPVDNSRYCATSAFDAVSPILQEVDSNLRCLNILVEQLHAEAGNGQFEISLGHKDSILAADNLIYAREVIRSVARKHGLLATLAPKYRLDEFGSGSHVHLSLWEDGTNVFMGSEASKPRYGMSEVGEKFMAGVYTHLPSILAFTAPLPNSYDRIQPDTWSGAYHCWGKENREAPLRTACPPGVSIELVSNFEIKSFDGCANPHLGLASIIAAGIDGLRHNLSLPEPVETNPSSYHSELRRLPKTLQESVEALSKDDILIDSLGEKLVSTIIAVRKAEINYYAKNKEAYKELIHQY